MGKSGAEYENRRLLAELDDVNEYWGDAPQTGQSLSNDEALFLLQASSEVANRALMPKLGQAAARLAAELNRQRVVDGGRLARTVTSQQALGVFAAQVQARRTILNDDAIAQVVRLARKHGSIMPKIDLAAEREEAALDALGAGINAATDATERIKSWWRRL